MTDEEIKVFKAQIEAIQKELGSQLFQDSWQGRMISASVTAILAILDRFNDRLVKLERFTQSDIYGK